jgi:Cu2+-exporting ATPase
VVKSGRSTIDESSFTGEPLPVTKESGVTFYSTPIYI